MAVACPMHSKVSTLNERCWCSVGRADLFVGPWRDRAFGYENISPVTSNGTVTSGRA